MSARDDVRSVAAAMQMLFQAARGGSLGLFTAIRRLKLVHDIIATPLAEAGLSLYAQHVDPLDVSDLISVFRSEHHSCLLGTDAVRDGIDVPGQGAAPDRLRPHAVAASGHSAPRPPRPFRQQAL